MNDLLNVQHVSKYFGDYKALNDVSFRLAKGSILGLLGPNGAGKTTLLRILTQIGKADAGTILYGPEPLAEKHRHLMGYLPEERGLYRKLKVKDQLVYFATLRGMSPTLAKAETARWCERLEITPLMQLPLESLSKGQQQKVQFISSVIHTPELLILDEPFSGFDPANAELIKGEIKQLHAAGTTIIYSTHRMDTVEDVCDELILINRSRLVLQGSPDSIRRRFDKGQLKLKFKGTIPSAYKQAVLEEKKGEDGMMELLLQSDTDKQRLIRAFLEEGVLTFIEDHLPSMHDIFLQVVKEDAQ